MARFRPGDGSYRRIVYGAAAEAGLIEDQATGALAPKIGEPTRRLKDAMRARQDAEIERACVSAQCGQAELRLEATLRALQKTVGALTFSTRGALERDLFPEGLVGAITPRREAQLDMAVEIVGRLKASECEGAEGVRSAFLGPLEAAIERFDRSLEKWRTASKLLRQLRSAERVARKVHARALLIVDAALRGQFPEDPGRRTAFLPRPPRRPRKSAIAPGEEETEDMEDDLELDDDELDLPPPAVPPPGESGPV